MGLRSGGRSLSFQILRTNGFPEEDTLLRSSSEPVNPDSDVLNINKRKKRKHRKKKSAKPSTASNDPVDEKSVVDSNSIARVPEDNFTELSCLSYGVGTSASVCTVLDGYGLRQRQINGVIGEEAVEGVSEGGEDREEEVSSAHRERREVKENGSVGNTAPMLETEKSLDWRQLMKENPITADFFPEENKSPVRYFMEEMCNGNSLHKTTTMGNEKERERVYDTIFRLPWRCELLIDVGFFVCFDAFLSLFTIMPTRILMMLWRLFKTRQFKRPSAAELSDFGCFLVLACGVALLQWTDISLIYHMIRGQGTIKLYVVYNVLEIFDRLFQSFGGDVLQTLFNSAEGIESCSAENLNFWIKRFFFDQVLAAVAFICHSFILLVQAITLSTCIVAHNNALMALLVSNNFAEIKSNVFKRFSKDNIHSLVYADSVERFHITAFLLFVLAQNILEAEGPWFESFLFNALLVYFCEVLIDIIKHSFLAKFNNIKPTAYSEFLEDLSKQTLDVEGADTKKNLTFVPLAPASVVIRVLTPVYTAHLPHSPLPWRLFWIVVLSAMTFIMLASLKVMIGMCLRKHATWYLNRCQKRKLHSD